MTSRDAVTGSLLCSPAVSGAARACTTIHGKCAAKSPMSTVRCGPEAPRPAGWPSQGPSTLHTPTPSAKNYPEVITDA